MPNLYRAIAPLLLSSLIFLTACGTSAPPPVSNNRPTSTTTTTTKPQSQTQTTTPKKTVAKTPTDKAQPAASPLKDIAGLPPQKGSAFNKFFPKVKGTEYESTFSQEKSGFAEIKLTQKGTLVARISISDTVTNLDARNKFIGVKEQVSGFPVIAQGKNATAVLVGDRYQVKVMSQGSTITESDRKDWLAKVDLQGLSKLK